jgi:protein-L-isoaspartate(D-aspartate) O-methyltransferase
MTDSFVRARDRMVEEQVVRRGVKDARVVAALQKVPRHLFVEPALAQRCYDTRSLPIGQEQTISQPYVVAYMAEQLLLTKEHKVLEVGTGSGYTCAVLAELAGEVFTIECLDSLQNRARRILNSLRYCNVHYQVGDGAQGWREALKFDRILVTASAVEIPHRLLEQLKDPGRLIIPLVRGNVQELTLAIKVQGKLRRRKLATCDFVPLVGST